MIGSIMEAPQLQETWPPTYPETWASDMDQRRGNRKFTKDNAMGEAQKASPLQH